MGALENGVRALDPDAITLSARVVGVEQDEASASVLLEDGSKVTGDVVIGADGWRSAVRTALWGPHSPEFSGMVAWRGLVNWDDLPEHMQQWVGSTWIGPGGHAVSYPLHGGKIMNFVATIEDKTWTAEGGTEPGVTSTTGAWGLRASIAGGRGAASVYRSAVSLVFPVVACSNGRGDSARSRSAKRAGIPVHRFEMPRQYR